MKKTTRTRQIVCEVDPTPFDEELKKVKESLSARDWLGGKILGVFNETEKTVHQIFCQKNAGIAVKIVKEKLTCSCFFCFGVSGLRIFLMVMTSSGGVCNLKPRIEDWQLPTCELRNLVEIYKEILEDKLLGKISLQTSRLRNMSGWCTIGRIYIYIYT